MNHAQFVESSNLDRIRELSSKITPDTLSGYAKVGRLNIEGITVNLEIARTGDHIPSSQSKHLKVFILHSGKATITINGIEYNIAMPGSLRYVNPNSAFSILFMLDTNYTCLTIPVTVAEAG